jgi:2',3'-cyclic-nucleotide 2'-phosphodiesterase (5'-nucleotidase family)
MKRAPLFRVLALAAVFAGCARQPYVVQRHTARLYSFDSTSAPDSALVRLIRPYKAGVDTLMTTVIGQAAIPLTKAQPECTLGNFMADAQLDAARKIDARVVASVVNYGGIRLPYLPPGPVTKGAMFELMPFDNIVTIVEVPGSVLYRFADHMAARKGWPVAGMRYTVKDKKATGLTLDGQEVDSARIYKITVSDYIAGGGDDCDFLRPLKKRYTSVFLRDAMMAYIAALDKTGQPLFPKIEGRVSYAE